jgi:NAD-dependent dihydropyrimidine dehydrogenase PreA subunit
MYRVNKQNCLGIKNCGICQKNCPGATEEGENGKAEIVDQEKLKKCGGESVCPMGAIEKVDKEDSTQSQEKPSSNIQGRGLAQGRGLGLGPRDGRGRGMGAGRGRGLGLGPRDGRGRGRGGGGRR